MNVKVIDNFLPPYSFRQIQSVMMGDEFPWYLNDGILYKGDPNYQLTHALYDESGLIGCPTFRQNSHHMVLFDYCLKNLGVKKLLRIKANLNPSQTYHQRGGYHIDYRDVTTAVYYVNTNNGWTHIKGYGKVKCVENRMVIFDSNLQHEGVTCTKGKVKIVVNFNYIDNMG